MVDTPTPVKAQAPGAVSPAIGPNAAPAGDKLAAGQPDLAATVSEMKGRLTELGKSNDELKQTLLNQRRLEQKRDTTIHGLRQFKQSVLEQARSGGYIDPNQFSDPTQQTATEQSTAQPQAGTGIAPDEWDYYRWKIDHPNLIEKFPEMEKIFLAETPKFASIDRVNQTVDVYGSFENIRKHMEATEMDAKHKAELEERDAKITELQNTESNRNRQALNRMAYISGTPAAGTDQARPDYKRADGTPMTSDEMVVEAYNRGELEIDPNDPPKALRNLKR